MSLGGPLSRRGLLSAGTALAMAAAPATAVGEAMAGKSGGPPRHGLSALQFGAIGDGVADVTDALQAALDAAFAAPSATILVIPPGTYKVTRTLRITLERDKNGDIGRQSGIVAHGARIASAIEDGGNVLELDCRATVRFVIIEGLDILGSGRDGDGIHIQCDGNRYYFYNFCLRDIDVQACGGDGCAMFGDVFEGQVINCYFRKNRRNGMTFGHGRYGGILSSIHVFGCVLGDNGRHGAALVNKCYDVAFHGCYFLLNGQFGLDAENGCTLLSNCGFENNHQGAHGFDDGGAGVNLANFGTLIGCTAYSIFNQTDLIRAYVVGQLVLVGCTGSGDGRARAAALAKIAGVATGSATLIGCSGAIVYQDGFEGIEVGGRAGGIRFGSAWHSRNLAQLGEYRLWIDRNGRLRLKRGAPQSDEDGTVVGA